MNNPTAQTGLAIAADIYWDRAQAALSEAQANPTDSELLERLEATAHQNAALIEGLLEDAEKAPGWNTENEQRLANYRDEAQEAAEQVSSLYEQSYEA